MQTLRTVIDNCFGKCSTVEIGSSLCTVPHSKSKICSLKLREYCGAIRRMLNHNNPGANRFAA